MERIIGTDAPPPPTTQTAPLIDAPAPWEYKHDVDYSINAPPPPPKKK